MADIFKDLMTPRMFAAEGLLQFKVTSTAQEGESEAMTVEKMTETMRTISRVVKPIPRFVESELLVDRVEDWSGCRSPSRARRRHKQGHKQHVVMVDVPKPGAYQIGNEIFIHPFTMAKVRKALSENVERRMDDAMMGALGRFGGIQI